MGEMIELTSADGHKFQAYAAGDPKSPRALVVVQEIFGVNRHMRDVADRLAQSGYYVLSPAVFDRAERNVELDYTAEGVKKGLELRAAIAESDVMMDIEATAAKLSPRPTGIIGYCWGGTIAWWGATKSKSFRAAVTWYGGGIMQTKEAVPNCPVQMHFGALDKGIPMSDVEAIKQSQPEIPVFIYENADHGFGCDDRASFNAEANKLAEQRSLAFFAEHLV
ncbi:dienelactone hydrolase family protein [Acidiphilium acidophilum]|uniref:Dienelactone hydrolase family protein n=1 Tax=Acidiphilium acidophilum TaxID=76588 RepID=A0AAW9DRG3_ACIAO|nr:dienelactone hydrolase family protein [Acidiphilium acidophilum]MDX5931799.1 dienelactone hydrolase family protein [Acidiphilium acidophilum]